MGIDSTRQQFRIFAGLAANRRDRVRRRLARENAIAPRGNVEGLEQRLFLSVSALTIAGPITIPGNSWTYMGVGAPGNETQTVVGPATFNGMSVTQENVVDVVNGKTTSTGTNYYTLSAAGYFNYGFTSTSANSGVTQTTTYTPNEPMLPASLSASVPVTSPTFDETDTDSISPDDASYETVSTTFTLTSETPTVPVTAGGNNYNCFQVNVTQVTTSTDSTFTMPQGAPMTDNSEYFFSPTAGLIESIDQTTGLTILLSNFTGTADHLAVTVQPSNTLVGDNIDPAVTVELDLASGLPDTDPADATTITASLSSSSTGTGTLMSQPVTTVGGVATFSDLSLDKPGGYTLTFAASNGLTVPSNSFQVGVGKLVFEYIKDGDAGLALDPAVMVKLENSKNKVITDFPSLVTVNVATGPGTAITGNMQELANGVAIFKDLKLPTAGSYTLGATDDQGDLSGTSNSFLNSGYQLSFRPEPAKAGVGSALRYAVVLENAKHQTVTADSTDYVMLTLNTVEGGANAMLSSSVSVLERGVALNEAADGAPAVSINSPGTYTLTATLMSPNGSAPTAYALATVPGMSKEFDVVADHLYFTKVPSHAFVNIGLSYEVVLRDYQNHTITSDSTDHLQFTLNTSSGGAGAMLANPLQPLRMGISDNSATPTPMYITAPGTYTLTVTEIPSVTGDPVAPVITSKPFTVKKAAS